MIAKKVFEKLTKKELLRVLAFLISVNRDLKKKVKNLERLAGEWENHNWK